MAAPAIPQNLTVQQANGQVLVKCDQVAGATSYPIQRSVDNVTFSLLASPTTPSYLDTTVTVNTQYFYKIASSNGTVSAYTNSQSVIPTISGKMSLGELRLRSKQRADREESQFVTDPEWNSYINQSYFELYDLLVTAYEDYYIAAPAIFQTTGQSQLYPLPDGITQFYDQTMTQFVAKPFYKLKGVDCGLSANADSWISIHKYNFIDRNRYIFPNLTSTYLGVFNLRYRVLDNNLSFIPNPAGNQLMRLWYIPRMTELLQDTDIVDGVSGWTEYIIIDAAIKALQKEESPVETLAAQKQAIIDRIQAAAMNRDAGEPDTISNTRSWADRYGSGGDGSEGFGGGY